MSTRVMTASARSRAMPWFGLGFATCCAVLVFFGFSFTFIPEVINRVRPSWLHLHIATAAAWMILLVVQAALATTRKLTLHRRLGTYGFVLGVAAAITAITTSLVLRHDSVMAHGDDRRIERIAFLSIPLNGAIVFAALLACAYLWRHRPSIHRRCMLLAAAVLTLPAVARIPVIGDMDLVNYLPTDVLILTLCCVDLWRERTLHWVYRIGVPAIFAMQYLTSWLFTSHPDWWVRTAALMIGL